MKLRPFKEMIALSKEKLDEALAPVRSRQVELQAKLEQSKLESEILSKEVQVQEMLTNKTVDFPRLMDRLDEIALLERRKAQYDELLAQLFPEKVV